jgi:hypothetical protein
MLRSLENYKEMHKQRARDKGVYDMFMQCSTLTMARKILFGTKTKTPNCSKCHHKVTDCNCSKR